MGADFERPFRSFKDFGFYSERFCRGVTISDVSKGLLWLLLRTDWDAETQLESSRKRMIVVAEELGRSDWALDVFCRCSQQDFLIG